jgi:hypothetical protein
VSSSRKDIARSGPVKRPYRTRERKRRFLLYCEGAETEPSYFRGLVQFLRSRLIEIEIGNKQKDPKKLVELAIGHRDRAQREARKEKDDSLLFDEVWCVFDVDTHARLQEAKQLAEANSIKLAISNPSFELWLLIHFTYQWAYITGDDARTAVRRYMPAYDKKVEYRLIAGKGNDAITRGEEMERRAHRNGDRAGNPTTGMWQLATELCKHANFSSSNL